MRAPNRGQSRLFRKYTLTFYFRPSATDLMSERARRDVAGKRQRHEPEA